MPPQPTSSSTSTTSPQKDKQSCSTQPATCCVEGSPSSVTPTKHQRTASKAEGGTAQPSVAHRGTVPPLATGSLDSEYSRREAERAKQDARAAKASKRTDWDVKRAQLYVWNMALREAAEREWRVSDGLAGRNGVSANDGV